MSMPNLLSATAAEIINHEKCRAAKHESTDRGDRYQYLSTRLAIVIELMVEQRDLK